MRNNERSNRDSSAREQYAIFDFTRFGMIDLLSIIGIGIFMRVVLAKKILVSLCLRGNV